MPNRRTLQKDHPYLAQVLRAGMTILDVGCGSGSITADIARAVGSDGMVLGIDREEANLAIAVQEQSGIFNLRLERADILTFDIGKTPYSGFDIVTAARTVQWISEPERAIVQMKKATRPEGHVVVLDYNLDETHWEPEPPVAFQRFYQAFLDWRTANHWDNRTASHLTKWFHSAGLTDIAIHPTDETVRRGDPDFFGAYASGIWLYVIETFGPALVEAGFLEEDVRGRAEKDYRSYVQANLQLQRHPMLTVDGKIPPATI